jgi:glycosyltransferase involved in cell wall biosynthesis
MDMGGAQRQLFNLAVGLDRSRFRPTVVCLHREEPLLQALRDRGVPAHCLPARRGIDPTLPIRLARVARRERARILHSYLFQANAWSRMAARLAGAPVTIASVRTGRPHRRRLEYLVERALASWTTAYLVNAHAVGRRLAEQFPRFADRIVCIYNGIDLGPYDLDRDGCRRRLRAALGVPPGAPLLGVLGALMPDKGHRFLLEALDRMRGSDPGPHLAVIGAGALAGDLRRRAGDLRLSDRVHLLGHRDDVPELLGGLDLLAQSSLREGMPNAVLEGMAACLPIVATRVGGTAEALQDGACGVLVEPGSAAALADGIRSLLGEPARAARLAALARGRVESHFSLEAMIRRTEALYLDLLRRDARGAPAGTAADAPA